LCSGTPSPACRKIGATNWKGHWSCPTPHWKTPCAYTSWWSSWCVIRCCIVWLGRVVRPWFHWYFFGIKSDQDKANTHLTRLRWNVTMPPWQTNTAK
jgi:hypothetical protein